MKYPKPMFGVGSELTLNKEVYKVRRYYKSNDSYKVVLQTDSGKEVSVDISKLEKAVRHNDAVVKIDKMVRVGK